MSFNWCIDAGNSSVKLGVFKDSCLLEFFQFRETPSSEKLKAIEEQYPPSKIAVSSVIGHLNWLGFSGS